MSNLNTQLNSWMSLFDIAISNKLDAWLSKSDNGITKREQLDYLDPEDLIYIVWRAATLTERDSKASTADQIDATRYRYLRDVSCSTAESDWDTVIDSGIIMDKITNKELK